MNPSPLRCGIVGTGTFGAVHATAIAALPSLQLVSVCDSDPASANAFAAEWKCTVSGDCAALLQNDLAIVAVTTPNTTHANIVESLLRDPHAPRLVIVEKPLCTSRAELQAFEKLLKGKEDRLVVDHSRRFNAGFTRVKELIASGELGGVRSVHWKYYAGWLHIGSHVVDTLQMLLGDLTCITARKKAIDRFPDDPLLDVELRSERYPQAQIRLEGIPEHPYGMFEAEIFCEKGRIRIQWDEVFIDRLRGHGTRAPLLCFAEHFTVEPVEVAVQHLYAMSEALITKNDRSILELAGFTATQGTMNILFAAQRAAHL